ncbi:hypothetical protein AAZX31_17G163400 [Glycine max]|uniref:Knottin scorpion toxin-like domain-containing protein n=2 Tax=Glycine subgen. Soja TaxID=1462606 RepID=K7MM30_SOYBN|nr:hypothetical protein JHK86_047667 [Glycine max]KAG4933474.1 hypothetical protein JHK87_047476 [Glycine soja]KAG4943638.1 hypothetical protein JHK85_048284 [Glycine max]KAG5097928.1 hypothetical protein JHK82_047782 [Glycine max]KAG5102723.1 hypothetical protein JHK84_047692 [Glycine max]
MKTAFYFAGIFLLVLHTVFGNQVQMAVVPERCLGKNLYGFCKFNEDPCNFRCKQSFGSDYHGICSIRFHFCICRNC